MKNPCFKDNADIKVGTILYSTRYLLVDTECFPIHSFCVFTMSSEYRVSAQLFVVGCRLCRYLLMYGVWVIPNLIPCCQVFPSIFRGKSRTVFSLVRYTHQWHSGLM